jgi:hypothetical protein
MRRGRGKNSEVGVLSVIFDTEVQDVERRFSLPGQMAKLLGVGSKDYVMLAIAGTDGIGEDERRKLVSGVEILDQSP